MRKYLFIVALALVPSVALAQGPVQVTSSHGPVEYEFASGARLLPVDSKLPSLDIGDKIRTGAGAQLTLGLPDGSYIVVSENTTLEIEKFWGSEVRNLMKVMLGRVRFFIQRLGGRPNPYRVNTPTALIAVRGTTFEVIAGPLSTEVRCFDWPCDRRDRRYGGPRGDPGCRSKDDGGYGRVSDETGPDG